MSAVSSAAEQREQTLETRLVLTRSVGYDSVGGEHRARRGDIARGRLSSTARQLAAHDYAPKSFRELMRCDAGGFIAAIDNGRRGAGRCGSRGALPGRGKRPAGASRVCRIEPAFARARARAGTTSIISPARSPAAASRSGGSSNCSCWRSATIGSIRRIGRAPSGTCSRTRVRVCSRTVNPADARGKPRRTDSAGERLRHRPHADPAGRWDCVIARRQQSRSSPNGSIG